MPIKLLLRQVSDRVEDLGAAEDGLAGMLAQDFCKAAYIMPEPKKGQKGWRVVSLNDLGQNLDEEDLGQLQSVAYVDEAASARIEALEEHLRRALRFMAAPEAMGVDSGIVQAGEDKATCLNIDEAKALVGL